MSSRSSADNSTVSAERPRSSRHHYDWDREPAKNEAPVQEIQETPAPANPYAEMSNLAGANSEDDIIVALLNDCRQAIDSGNRDEAARLIADARDTYGRNLRIEAFAWKYLQDA